MSPVGATDTCTHCGLPIKNTDDWGWIVYPASQAHSDDPADCPRGGFERAHVPQPTD